VTPKGSIIGGLSLIVIIVYLFVTAPLPLQENQKIGKLISITQVFETLNEENRIVRRLYTKDIVGAGEKNGLRFDEDWRDAAVEAGPLPAQFLRATAMSLERSKVRLGLYLGSDYPINSANKFSGEQLLKFHELRKTGNPQFFFVNDVKLYSYMFADMAIAKPCVQCHNDHQDTPKSDWQLNDMMGATTWTYPGQAVTFDEYFEIMLALRKAFKAAYAAYLDKVSTFKNPPDIGEKWPQQGYYLPSLAVFSQAIEQQASVKTLRAISNVVAEKLYYAPSSSSTHQAK